MCKDLRLYVYKNIEAQKVSFNFLLLTNLFWNNQVSLIRLFKKGKCRTERLWLYFIIIWNFTRINYINIFTNTLSNYT